MMYIFIMFLHGVTDYSLEEIMYSVESLFTTGVVQEDSIFWNCATMGNGICG